MNDTRKQIIELIDPYMSKDLSFGCLVQCDDIYMISACNHPDYGNTPLHTLTYANHNWELYIESEDISDMKILWHYDITSVLKCIGKKEPDMQIWIWSKSKVMEIHKYIWDECEKCGMWHKQKAIWLLPNKPLTLYTEQEEERLLELLLKLNK